MQPTRKTLAALLLLSLVLLGAGGCRRSHGSDRGQVRGPLGEALDAYLSRLESFGFSGSAFVAKDGEIVLDKGYGLADRAGRRPYTADTIFDIASISKQFTAAAILKLEMEGKLKVEDPIAKYFGPVPADKEPITLHRLLTHTAGLAESFGDEYEPVSRQELIRRALAAPLIVRPGRKFRYSNAGYGLLAAVVEIASGEPFETYLRERVWQPAGLRHTGFHVPDRERAARGYAPDIDWGTAFDHPWAPDGPYWNLRGCGGVLTTGGDLYRWHQALAGDRVLSKAEREKLITPWVSQGRAAHASYGYGWAIEKSPTGGRLLSHLGGNLVFEADFRRYLDDGVVIVLSSNGADYSGIAIGPHLQNRIFGLPDPEPPVPVTADPALLARRAGLYAFPNGDQLRVAAVTSAAGGRLALTALGPQAFTVLLGDQDAEQRDLMARREQKTAEALDGLRRGDTGPLGELRSLPAATAADEARAAFAPWEQRLGAWRSTQVLGNGSYGGHPYTYARLGFERGTKIVEYGWSGMGLETVRFLDAPPAILFVPQKDGSFASFDVRTGVVVRLRFEDPAGGAPATLVATTSNGAVFARRVGA